VFDSQCNSP